MRVRHPARDRLHRGSRRRVRRRLGATAGIGPAPTPEGLLSVDRSVAEPAERRHRLLLDCVEYTERYLRTRAGCRRSVQDRPPDAPSGSTDRNLRHRVHPIAHRSGALALIHGRTPPALSAAQSTTRRSSAVRRRTPTSTHARSVWPTPSAGWSSATAWTPAWPRLVASPRDPASVRLVVHPLHRLGRVLGRVDGVLELGVQVAPLDDLDRRRARRGTAARWPPATARRPPSRARGPRRGGPRGPSSRRACAVPRRARRPGRRGWPRAGRASAVGSLDAVDHERLGDRLDAVDDVVEPRRRARGCPRGRTA